MKRSKGWVSVIALGVSLFVVLGFSFGSFAFAQEARWKTLKNQAKALHDQGKYREAILVAKEALKVAEQTFGPDNLGVAQSLNRLAMLYNAQGLYGDAEPLLKRSLKIYEKSLGPDHPHVAAVLDNLAELYIKMGRNDEAVPLLNRARKIQLGL